MTGPRLMRHFRIAGWERTQHYRGRTPPWIKLHRDLLDSYAFCSLPDAAKAHAVLLMLLASRLDNILPWDEAWIASQISCRSVRLAPLLSAGIIEECAHDASAPQARREREARPETETERETEAETDGNGAGDSGGGDLIEGGRRRRMAG